MRRRTAATWWVARRFRKLERPRSLTWGQAERSLAYLTARLGRWHPDTTNARLKLALWRGEEGHTAAALRMAEKEVASRTAEFGPDSPGTLTARWTLLWRRNWVRDLDKALADARLLVDDLTRKHGPDHEDTQYARMVLVKFLGEDGDLPGTIRRLTALYAESQGFGGKRESMTRSIRTDLVRALERNGDHQEALVLLDEEIAAERSTIYGVDENLGGGTMKFLQEWRKRLDGRARKRRPERQ